MRNRTFYQKSTPKIKLVFKNKSDDSVFDLTNYTVVFSAKKHYNDIDEIITVEATINTPTTGVCYIEFTTNDLDISPDTYLYVIVLKTTANNNTVKPIESGELIINTNVHNL